MKRLPAAALLLALWLALWGEVSLANLLSGAVVVPLALRAVPEQRDHRVHPLAAAWLGLVFLGRLVTSSLVVARAVVAPTPERLATRVVRFELRSGSDLVATVLADAISLTPGTLTLDVVGDARALDVHVMGEMTPEEVEADLRGLEALVVAAFEPIGEEGAR